MSTEPPTATATYLGCYRRALIAEGIGGDLLDDLVRDAAHVLVENDGLAVAAAKPPVGGHATVVADSTAAAILQGLNIEATGVPSS